MLSLSLSNASLLVGTHRKQLGIGRAMSFPKHVFISYAHIDNAVPGSVSRGWVDHLQENLELRLAQLLGHKPVLWRDKAELRGNRVFKDTIAIGLTETGVFLSILSPRYLDSTSCQEELEGFLNAAPRNGGLRLGDKHRIFKVVKTPVELALHPEPIRDLLGYEFYAQDPITKRFREYEHERGPNGEKDKRYWERLDDLAQDITTLLKELQGTPAPKPGATIFLAETTSDVTEARDKVRRELRQFGHVVLPDQPLPANRPQLERLVREHLQRSRLSVHLLGAHYGLIPELENNNRSIVRLQQELAREYSQQHDFTSLIWLPPGLEPKEEPQRRFIAELKENVHTAGGSDLIEAKIEDLKTIIQEKLNAPPKTVVTEKADDGVKRVYLVCDQCDFEDIEPVYNYLSQEGYGVLVPEFDENALLAHKQYVLDCEAVLFYFDKAPEMWLQTRLRGLTGFGRRRPFAAVGVLLAGEETFKKRIFKTPDALVVKNFGAIASADLPALLREFMHKLTQAKGGAR
ncbi:MAG: TIR domain-containing protein [Acidobacteria bacterium]|nr:TIR domain-containing protein [Acidobacteriota bacterium]